MTLILVVDDEKEIADLVELYLVGEGYNVVTAYSGTVALEKINELTIDLAILDIMLPDISGLEISKIIRETQNFPIIMLTAKDQEIDKITGLTLGADDYVTKPFQPLELVARVKAQLRRYTRYNEGASPEEEEAIYHKGLVVNKSTHSVSVNNKNVDLTPIEFGILWVLLSELGKVVKSEGLFLKVWGDSYYDGANNTVMVHIRHLRAKIEGPSEQHRYIKTVWGVGYKIEK